ncbi:hypothetical protein AVEN_37018-1, partial [Araneus ventricosus]
GFSSLKRKISTNICSIPYPNMAKRVLKKGGKMFPSKLPLLLLGFLVAGTALTSIRAMPIDEYDYPINGIENEIFEEEISADKNGIVDDEEVEEGEAEERNVLNELDAEIEEEAAKDEEEEAAKKGEEEGELDNDVEEDEPKDEEEIADEKKDEADEEEFEEEIADAEEGSEEVDKENEDEEEADEEEEKAIADEEEVAEEEEKIADEEEEGAEEEEEEGGKKRFPYSWYDKVKKFFKGQK